MPSLPIVSTLANGIFRVLTLKRPSYLASADAEHRLT